MTGGKRLLRPSALVVAAVTLLITLGQGLGSTSDAERGPTGSSAAAIVGAIGAAPPGLLDTRVQRGVELRQGDRASQHHDLSGQAALNPCPPRWVRALAGVLERADHPERLGETCPRGPPALSS